ncbi:hypothetical protein ACTACV_18715 [Pseudomonas syringae]|uniref:hypothetical protein n=1 Tax=Pseudomonas syringae TaxID=317 RepID=UPI003F74DEB9
MAKIYVLDQNYLRSDDLKNLIASDPHAKFVLPDVALLEMCKGNRWRETMVGSLATLSQAPGRVMHSMSIGEAMRFELAEMKSIHGRLLPKDLTKLIRSIMRDVAANDLSGPGVSMISMSIEDVQNEIRKDELDHDRNQASLKTRTAIMKTALGTARLKELKSVAPEEVRLGVIHAVAHDLVQKFLASEGHSSNRITSFLKTKPLLLRFFS